MIDAKAKAIELRNVGMTLYLHEECLSIIEKDILSIYEAGKNDGYNKLANEIDNIIAEFGDDSKTCAQIIGEHLHGDCSSIEY